VSFSVDSLFDFSKDTVRPAGKVALNEFAAQLQGGRFKFITVTGHTDRGVDGEDPVTKPHDCPGRERTPRLIACLQPDRRVDVEVTAVETTPASSN
jgi:OmpA-OmpF porin, OOP family